MKELTERQEMTTQEAMEVLGIVPGDDAQEIKRKYRRMISLFHPDSFSKAEKENIHHAQEINEAYRVLRKAENVINKNQKEYKAQKKAKTVFWNGECNEMAFAGRNVYIYYSMDVPKEKNISEEPLFYQIAEGKYMWNPEEEDFALFLTSVRHAASALLEKVEIETAADLSAIPDLKEHRFRILAKLFEYLSLEYVSPVKCLESFMKPESIDGKGQRIYHLRAFLAADGSCAEGRLMRNLKSEEYLYPSAFHGNQIRIVTEKRQSLGYLHMEDDRLYFCIIPLLKSHAAQVKLLVKSVKTSGNSRNIKVKTDVEFYLRLEDANYNCNYSELNLKTENVLNEYRKYLRQERNEKFPELFARLSKSDFRSRFCLKEKEIQYIQEKGMDTIRSHAEDFVRMRLAPARIPNDGKQTPMRGHPVFLAQHATGCCCRGCLYKWHRIPAGTQLTKEQQEYVVEVLMEWITRQLDRK